MESSELFWLLPVYEEAEGQPHYIKRTGLMTEEELRNFVGKIDEVHLFFVHENYTVYYDSENVHAFLEPVVLLEEDYPYKGARLWQLALNEWEDWRRNKRQQDTDRYQYYKDSIQNDTLCEITKRKSTSSVDTTYLLVNHEAFDCAGKSLRTACNGKEIEIDVCRLVVEEMACWLEENRRPQRFYNWNCKHGEHGKGAHPSNKGDHVSVLMGSREEAARLLKKAVGEDDRVLFYYDGACGRYIEFRKESENTYHAFHLEPADERRIPPAVKERIGRLEGK